MLNEKMVSLGMRRSVIREIFEYGKKRKAEIGEESVFDFSLGNPSVPTPAAVTAALERIIKETDPVRAARLHLRAGGYGGKGKNCRKY